jgi:putative Ca2+/H+ antiporter (TMEM165/GDT1 family)
MTQALDKEGISHMSFDLSVFMTTLSMVLIMEMGDKTQLLVMACASKYKPRQVLMGITMAIVLLNLLAVALGSVIGGIKMIQDIVKAGASLLFIFFGFCLFGRSKARNPARPEVHGMQLSAWPWLSSWLRSVIKRSFPHFPLRPCIPAAL